MNQGNGADATAMLGSLCVLGIILALVALGIAVWWKIFDKAGYGGAMGLLMLLPIINLIMLLVLAFGEWPIQAELRRLRRELEERDDGGRRYGGDLPREGFQKREPGKEGEFGYRQ